MCVSRDEGGEDVHGSELIEGILAISPAIRYVGVRRGREVVLRQREGLRDPSSSESDRYEELLVNPTLLTLASGGG